jgi:uncharacterized protein YndB with AHSA1/START domain
VASAETAAAVVREVQIDAAPETVYEFLVDPDRMIQWMGSKAELEPRPGGIFRVDLNGRNVARGEYVELDPPSRVVFSFGWEGGTSAVEPGASTVEVVLSPEGEGTLVRLAHKDLPEESRESHAHGWEHYMKRLTIAAADGDPGEDPWASPEGTEADQA